MTLPPPPATLPPDPSIIALPPGLGLLRFFDPSRGGWASHRFYGPLPDMRFDHHPPPPSVHPDRSVWYAACSLRGAVAEAFGRSGLIDREAGRCIVRAEVVVPLRVLDLVGVAARRLGLTQEIGATTDYPACQAWARACYDHYPIQGLRWRARQSGALCVVLNDRAPVDHLAHRLEAPLTDPRVWPRIARAARDCRIAIL